MNRKTIIVFSILMVWGVTTSIFTGLYFYRSKEKQVKAKPKPKRIAEDPIYSKSYWQGFQEIPIEKRIEPCTDPNIIRTVNQWKTNRRQEPDIVATQLSSEEKETVAAFLVLFSKWPENVQEYFKAHVARVFIVENLGTSAKAECMDEGDVFVIFINKSVLHEDPNEWITNAEITAISFADSNETLIIKIEEENSPARTIENIIIHELGHVIGLNLKLVPDWRSSNYDTVPYPVLQNEFYYHPQRLHRENSKDVIFNQVRYYGSEKDKIPLHQYLHLCDYMSNTSYPTIYGSQNEQEYFAELFYGYFHCIVQNRVYKLSITDAQGKYFECENGLREERCAYQRDVMKQITEGL